MSDSEDSYGPALPPGLKQAQKCESSSDDDQYGPALPKSFNNQNKDVTHTESDETAKHIVSKGDLIGPIMPSSYSKVANHSSDSDSDSSSSSSSSNSRHKSRRKKKHKKSRSSADISEKPKHVIGPAMPPGMGSSTNDRNILGPSLPPGMVGGGYQESDDDDDDDDDAIGPSLGLQATEEEQSAVNDFNSRSNKMMQNLSASEKPDESEGPKQRESWMTELPEGMGANIGLGNRQFRTRDAPEMDSSWTEAPHEKGKKNKEGKKRKKDKDEYFKSDKEKKAKRDIDAYNKKHRPKSLMEMHEKEMKKKKKKEKKKNKDKVPERRPFDRDLDLKVNKFDDAMKKAYIKRSQELGSRFKSGGTGTSFL